MWTTEQVEFRQGLNYGRGAEMHIYLLPANDRQQPDAPGLSFGGLDTFMLKHVEQMHMESAHAKTPPGAAAGPSGGVKQAGPARPAAGPLGGDGPTEITCTGPFEFDMGRQAATFHDQVKAWRINPNGQGDDHLDGNLLTLFFADRRPATPGNAQAQLPPTLADLEPRRIMAVGEPAALESPGQHMQARGQTLEYDLLSGRMKLASGDEAWVRQGINEIHAPDFQYQPGEKGRMGQVLAQGPAGSAAP